MGRKARFTTPESAYDWAITKGAPARGSYQPITSHTRGLVRFWLSAHGIPAEISAPLTVAQLSDIWHDTTNAKLDALRTSPAPSPAPIAPQEIKDVYQPPLRPTPAPSPSPAPAPQIEDPRLKLLAELFQPQPAAMDEGKVLEIMQRNLGSTITAATDTAAAKIRNDLDDMIAEARAIVNGAPRVLRIEIKDSVKVLDAAPRHPMFDALLTVAVCSKEPRGLHPMLIGPAGSGKTTACEQAAAALGLDFYTNGALTGAHELAGYRDGSGTYQTTAFREAFEKGGLYLADEMDRSDPAAPIWLNSAIANGFAGFPDSPKPIRMHKDFYCVAACNTYGRGANRLYVGANQLDGATLDRFAPMNWDYDETLERTLAADDAWASYVQAARKACDDFKVRHIISPRATFGGVNFRRAGMPFDLVADMTIWKGLDTDQRRKIEGAIPEGVTRRAQAPVMRAPAIAAE